MTAPPIPMMFDGETFRPLPRFHNEVAAHYGSGEVVVLAPVEERSKKSHDHFFVTLTEMWETRPEHLTDAYPTFDSFRKRALIAKGYCDVRTYVAASKAEAPRLAAFLGPMAPESVIVVRDAVVTIYTAHSQSRKAMGKETFQKSKDDCLAWAADQLGIDAARDLGSANNAPRRAA